MVLISTETFRKGQWTKNQVVLASQYYEDFIVFAFEEYGEWNQIICYFQKIAC